MPERARSRRSARCPIRIGYRLRAALASRAPREFPPNDVEFAMCSNDPASEPASFCLPAIDETCMPKFLHALDVDEVKDDPMAFRDRSLVKCVVSQNLKKFVGRGACANKPEVMIMTCADCGCESSHDCPFLLMRLPIEGCTKTSAQGGWVR